MSDSDPFPDPSRAPSESCVDDPAAVVPQARLGLGRRELAGLAAAAAAAPVIGLVPAVPTAAAAPVAERRGGRLQLRRESGSPLSALDVPLALGGDARRLPGRPVRTEVLATTTFSMLGVTWRAGRGVIRARTRRKSGGWTAWRELPALADGPDPGSDEARRSLRATEPVWVGPSDAVQIEITGTARRPVLALIDPGATRSDRIAARSLSRGTTKSTSGDDSAASEDTQDKQASTSTPRPPMRMRKAWKPNPKYLNGQPGKIVAVRQVHVHHTVSSNDYRRRDVPGMIRGMYRYHTNNLGWADIGYNFLVDRFGTIWVGRHGSAAIKKKVRGAHTLGFNDFSVGVSVIGNFETGKPTNKTINSIARIAAWQLDHYNRNPLKKIWVRSTGSDKFAAGTRVRLPVIDGHRDTNDTACPGRHLYKQIPKIRRRTARRMEKFA